MKKTKKLKKLPKPTRDQYMHAVDWAVEGFRHAQTVVQSRLYNYLMAASILFLAWAAIFTGEAGLYKELILLIIATVGAVLSVMWMLLGMRETKFVRLHMDIVYHLESLLRDPSLAVTQPISDLSDGKPVNLRSRDGQIQLGAPERLLRSSNLVVWPPLVFGVAFVLFMVFSLLS